MTIIVAAGFIATAAWWWDASLVFSMLGAILVTLLPMRDLHARKRLAPLLLVLAGITITLAVADPQIRSWF